MWFAPDLPIVTHIIFLQLNVVLYKSIFLRVVIFVNLPKRDIPPVFIFASSHEFVMSASDHETFRVLLFSRL